jgi:hypothetical protein
MKTAYVVVEGASDEEILRAVLDPKLIENVGIVPAGGLAIVPSLARSILVRRSVPVAVFIDSDSLNPEAISDRRVQFKELISSVAGRIPSLVVMVVPEVEAIFFSAPDLINGVFGQVPPELLALGQRDPKGILAHLESISNQRWDTKKAFEIMSQHDLELIRQTRPINELTGFLAQVQKAAAVA